MTIETRVAETQAERRDILRHRYAVYCEELKRDLEIADHSQRILSEPADDTSRHLGAWIGGDVAGSMRWVWGGDAPFTQHHVRRYQLGDFLASIPEDEIVIAERIAVSPEHRDGDVLEAMFACFMTFVNAHRIQLVVSDCAPHLLGLYTGLGYRPYSMVNINSAEAGYLIPLVLIAEDVSYLRKIGSPIAGALRDFGAGARVPEAAVNAVTGQSAIRSERLSGGRGYWRDLETAYALNELESLHPFDGLGEEEIRTVVANSHLIECRAGDRVIKKRDLARNMYVVLSGSLEVRDRDQYLATLMRGDVIGEIAFLLSTPRTADVVAMMDGTTLLSLSEATLQTLIAAHPGLAARFLLNLAKLLCAKLAFRPG